MKNLKKVLALVMAFATAFTVMAGAAFTDAADIKAGTAVDMLSALGVINGNPDGSFKPDGTVTRAEMAKMIYTIRSGGNDNADAYASTSTTFTDINGHWAAGYIKYCQSMGIIAGKSATTFDPDGLVTGVEAAKMMLVTMGYNADKAGLVGSTWSSKTLGYASENGLLDDVTAPLEKGLPRQYAAQLLYNGLDADTVTYDADSNSFNKVETTGLEKRETSTGNYQWVSITKNETVGKKFMKLDTLENEYIYEVKKEDGKDTFSINDSAYTKVKTDYSNLMGQKVKVMVKDNDTSKVYGVYADDDSKVIASTIVNKLDTVSGSTTKVKVNGTEYKLDADISTIKAQYFNTDTDYATLANLIANADTADEMAASVKLIDNDANGKIDAILVTPVTVKEVTYVSSTSITAGTSYKFADENIYDGVAKNDWAVIVDEAYTVDDKFSITKADTVTAKAGGVKSDSVQLGDTWYDYVKDAFDFNSGSTYECAVVGGIIFDAEETSDSGVKNVAFVAAVDSSLDGTLGSSEGTLESKLYFMDGSSKTVDVSKLDGVKLKVGGTWPQASTMYTYGVNSSGDYELKTIKSGNMAGYDSIKTGSGWDNKKANGYALADDSVVFAQITVSGHETVKVLSGKTVKDWNSTDAANFDSGISLVKEKNGINYAMVASLVADTVATDVPGASSDYSYAYVLNAYKSSLDGDDAIYVKLWNGTDEVETYIDSSTIPSDVFKGATIAYSVDGKYIDVEDVDMATVAITGIERADEGAVTYYAAATTPVDATMDDDCVVFAADSDDDVKAEGNLDSVPLADEVTDANGVNVTKNAVVFYEGTKVLAIIYDCNNEWKSTGSGTIQKSALAATAPTGMTLTGEATLVVSGFTYATGTKTYNPAAATFTDDSADALTLNVTAAADTTVSITSKIGAAGATAYTNNTALDIGAAAANVVFTVTVSQVNRANVVYTINVAVS